MGIRSFIRWCYGDDKELSPAEKFAKSPLAVAATPDGLIAAHCIESIAKNFDDWALTHGNDLTPRACFTSKYLYRLKNEKTDVDICWTHSKTYYPDYPFDDSEEWTDFLVNGVPIVHCEGQKIRRAYIRVKDAREKLEAEAAAAKKRMEENEKKWNLAERLLGMKRLPSGALVPKDYEGYQEAADNKFNPCPSSCCKGN